MVNVVRGLQRGLDGLGDFASAVGKTFASKEARHEAAALLKAGKRKTPMLDEAGKIIKVDGKIQYDIVDIGKFSGRNEHTGAFGRLVAGPVDYITAGIRAPFEWAGRLVGFGGRKLAVAHLSNPFLTTGTVVAAGGAYGLHEWQKGQRQDALQTQAAVQQAMMQSPYMNSVSPQEAALLESRFRSGGVSMAEMEEQRRMAAQGQPATNV
ncbi:MAG: hypothetical protein J0M34_09495 [Alphaproteobacteria bacterium]|nr:hypothetical protein [Alphaproteobacteria bacterium]